MKNNFFIVAAFLIMSLPCILFGQQKQEIVVHKMLLPAMVTETSKSAAVASIQAAHSLEKTSPLLRLEDAPLPKDGTVLPGKNASLRFQKQLFTVHLKTVPPPTDSAHGK